MTDIENFNKLGGVKKEVNDTIMKKQMVDLILARQTAEVNALTRLLSFGITENQILNACWVIEVNGNTYNTRSNKSQITVWVGLVRIRTSEYYQTLFQYLLDAEISEVTFIIVMFVLATHIHMHAETLMTISD